MTTSFPETGLVAAKTAPAGDIAADAGTYACATCMVDTTTTADTGDLLNVSVPVGQVDKRMTRS